MVVMEVRLPGLRINTQCLNNLLRQRTKMGTS